MIAVAGQCNVGAVKSPFTQYIPKEYHIAIRLTTVARRGILVAKEADFMKILLTAFDPFGGESVNPAQEAVRLVPETVCGAQIVKLEVPTVFGKSIDVVLQKARSVKPDAILCIGQSGYRFEITPERVADFILAFIAPKETNALS